MTQPGRPALPEPLRGRDEGTFAYDTVTVRMPERVRSVLAENRFPPEIEARLEALLADLPHGRVRPLRDAAAPDAAHWRAYVEPYLGQSWLEVPWFFAETYFFRRILEATGYFEPGAGQGVDPFAHQKRLGLEVALDDVEALSERLRVAPWEAEAFAELLHFDLWGNQADLNLWGADQADRPRHESTHQGAAHLLADDAPAVADYLSGLEDGTGRVDLIADNAGFELVCDLVLVDYLLASGKAGAVHVHLKIHPTFVSDALVVDVRRTLDVLAADAHAGARALGGRLLGALEAGRLRLREDAFWTSPLSGWEMPPALRDELARAQLVVSKGDANYRRLLGDRRWPYTTPFPAAVDYFPAPLVALRTLKSEILTGLPEGRAEALYREDPEWLLNGRWGVIQFVRPR